MYNMASFSFDSRARRVPDTSESPMVDSTIASLHLPKALLGKLETKLATVPCLVPRLQAASELMEKFRGDAPADRKLLPPAGAMACEHLFCLV